jgi:hypothetical protein
MSDGQLNWTIILKKVSDYIVFSLDCIYKRYTGKLIKLSVEQDKNCVHLREANKNDVRGEKYS